MASFFYDREGFFLVEFFKRGAKKFRALYADMKKLKRI